MNLAIAILAGGFAVGTAAGGGETFWQGLGHWYNAVYFIPFGVVLVFIVLQIIGAGLDTILDLGGGDADVDAGVDVDAGMDVDAGVDVDAGIDVDAGLDVDAGVDVDAGLDVDAGMDADVDAGVDVDVAVEAAPALDTGGHGVFVDMLLFFGAGRIPFSYLAEFYFLSLGIIGLSVNTALFTRHDVPEAPLFAASFAVSFIAATTLTKMLSLFWLKYLPTNEYSRKSRASFKGCTGEVVSAKVDASGGRAQIHDQEGILQVVFIRTRSDKKQIMKGEKVVLKRYLPKEKRYIVKRLDSGKE
jgi:hypothetical protein